MNLTSEQKSTRVLCVIAKMAKGNPNTAVKKTDLLEEINRSGVMLMSDEEFEKYRLETVSNFHQNLN